MDVIDERDYEKTQYAIYNSPFRTDGGYPKWPEEVPYWAGGQDGAEDFYASLKAAWMVNSDYHYRSLVAQHGGPEEWAVLANDENVIVRAAVAMAGDVTVQRKLCRDPSKFVREYVARNTQPEVLREMAETEQNEDVLKAIAKRKDIPSQRTIVSKHWDNPNLLCGICPMLPHTEKEKLLSHPDPKVRVTVGAYGSRRQAAIVLLDETITNEASKFFVEQRFQELSEIAKALVPSRHRERHLESSLER